MRTLEDIRVTERGDHKFTLVSITVTSPKHAVLLNIRNIDWVDNLVGLGASLPG